MSDERWLTVQQAADVIQVHPETVREWLRTGRLPGTLLSRRAGWRIREGDVLLLLDGHSFVGEEGGRALGRLRPGQALTLQYLRGGETLTTTTITPRAPSTD